jgi:hypothetical protein
MATYSFPALGFDPAPGNPGAVEALARDCTSSATQLAEDSSLLTGLQVDAWQGQAATAFTDDKQTLADDLTTASQAFGTAGTALDGYFAHLRRAQADAREAERQAAAALIDKRRLSGQVDDLNRQIQDAEDGSDISATERDRDGAQRALQGTSDAYDAAIAWARRIQQGVTDAGDDAARLLRAASDAPYEEPGLFDKAVGWAGDRLSDVGDAIDKWVDEHAGLLRKISGGLKIVSAVAGVLSFVPALTPIAGPIALASAGLALGIDGTLVATGNGDWKTLAIDAGFMLLPGVGRVASRFVLMSQAGRAAKRSVDLIRANAYTRFTSRTRPSSVSALRTRNFGKNLFEGWSKPPIPEGKIHPRLQRALDNVPRTLWREGQSGKCAEIKAINEALHSGAKLDDAVMATRHVRPNPDNLKHGQPHAACMTCKHVMNEFNITDEVSLTKSFGLKRR